MQGLCTICALLWANSVFLPLFFGILQNAGVMYPFCSLLLPPESKGWAANTDFFFLEQAINACCHDYYFAL